MGFDDAREDSAESQHEREIHECTEEIDRLKAEVQALRNNRLTWSGWTQIVSGLQAENSRLLAEVERLQGSVVMAEKAMALGHQTYEALKAEVDQLRRLKGTAATAIQLAEDLRDENRLLRLAMERIKFEAGPSNEVPLNAAVIRVHRIARDTLEGK